MITKKCPVCEMESGNLNMHLKSHNKGVENKGVEYATKDDLNEIKELIKGIAKKEPEKQEEKPEEPDIAPVSPKYRKLVDEILGEDFGINVSYPDTGGFLFKIMVPKEKSNASKAHLEFYKTDIRTKSIPYSEGIEGVRKYLEKVAGNLKITIKK